MEIALDMQVTLAGVDLLALVSLPAYKHGLYVYLFRSFKICLGNIL